MPVTNTVNTTELYHDLKAMDRDNFTYEGAKALMEYLEQLSEDCETTVDYDPIAFCCEFSEYGDIEDFNKAYYGDDFVDDPSVSPYETVDDLTQDTIVIEFNSGIIVQDF